MSRWSSNSGRALGNREDSRTFNAYLESLSAQVYFAKQKLTEGKKEITAEAIKDFIQGKVEAKKMILEIFSIIMIRWKRWLGENLLRQL